MQILFRLYILRLRRICALQIRANLKFFELFAINAPLILERNDFT